MSAEKSVYTLLTAVILLVCLSSCSDAEQGSDSPVLIRGFVWDDDDKNGIRGENEEGWSRGRYGAFHDFERWSQLVVEAGFEEIRHYYRPPGLPRDQQPWLATLWRRSDAP